MYRPGHDAGWGVLTGLEANTPAKSFYPSPDQAAAIVARATQLRGGGVVVGADDPDLAPRMDVLGDVAQAIDTAGRPGLQWAPLAELLTAHKPELYAGMTAEALSATVRGEGVPSKDVKDAEGRPAKGCYRRDVVAVIAARELEGR